MLAALAVGALAKDTYCPLNSDSCGGVDGEASRPFDSFFYCDGNAVVENDGVCGVIAEFVEGYKPVVIGATGNGDPIVFAARRGTTAESRFAGFTEMVYFICTSWDCSSISSVATLEGFNGNEAISVDHVWVGNERLLVVAGAGKLVAVPGHTKSSRPLYEVMYGYCVDSACTRFNTRVMSADLEESFPATNVIDREIVGGAPAAASRSNGNIVEIRTFGQGSNQRLAMIFMLGNDYESSLLPAQDAEGINSWWGLDLGGGAPKMAAKEESRGYFDEYQYFDLPAEPTLHSPGQSSWALLSICVNPPTCTERFDEVVFIGDANEISNWDTSDLGDFDTLLLAAFYGDEYNGSGSGSGSSGPSATKKSVDERQLDIGDVFDDFGSFTDYLQDIYDLLEGGHAFNHGRAPLSVFSQRPTPNILVASPQGLWLSFVGLHEQPDNQVFDTQLQYGDSWLAGSGMEGDGAFFADPANGYSYGSGGGPTQRVGDPGFGVPDRKVGERATSPFSFSDLLENNSRLPPRPQARPGATNQFWHCGTDGMSCRRAWNHNGFQHLYAPALVDPIGVGEEYGGSGSGSGSSGPIRPIRKETATRDLFTPYDGSASYATLFTSSIRNQVPDPQLGWQFAASRQSRDRRVRSPETMYPPTTTAPFVGPGPLSPHDPRHGIWNEFRTDNTYALATTPFAVGAAGNGFPATVGVVREDEPSGLGWSIVLAICLSDSCDKQVYRYLMDSATLHDNWGLLDDPLSGANEIINHPDGSWTIVLFVSPQSESTSVEWSRFAYDNPSNNPTTDRVADGTPNNAVGNPDLEYMAIFPHGHEGTSGKPLFITCLDELCTEASLSTIAPTRAQTMIPADLGSVDLAYGMNTADLPKDEYAPSYVNTWLGQFGPMKQPLMKRFYSSRPHSFAFTGPNSENLLVAIRDISVSADWDAPNYSPLRFWATNRYASPSGEPCSRANVGATVVAGEAVFVCTRLNTGSAAVMGGISGWVRYYEWVDVSKAFAARLWANIPAGISPFGVQPSVYQKAKPGMQYPQNLGAVYFEEQDQLAASIFDGELSNAFFGGFYPSIFDFYAGYVDYPRTDEEVYISAQIMNTPNLPIAPKTVEERRGDEYLRCEVCPEGSSVHECRARCAALTSTQEAVAEFDCENHRSDQTDFDYCYNDRRRP